MTARIEGIAACVFDAYGTLFDFNSAVANCAEIPDHKADRLSDIWRRKQLQYTWLRALMQQHADFWQVTGDALDFALAATGIDGATVRHKLMDLYGTLDTFPEVPDVLTRLKAAWKCLSPISSALLRAPTLLRARVLKRRLDPV